MTHDNAVKLGPDLDRLAVSNLLAQSGEQIALAAAPIVAVVMLGANIAETGGLQTILTLPFLLLAVPAGLLADRVSRRGLMVAAEALRAAAMLAVLGLVLSGEITWPLLAGLGFLAVAGTVVFSVAAPAIVPSLVTPALLSTANARIELGRTMAFAAGPALGGMLVGWSGAEAAYALAAALSVGTVLLLRGLNEPRLPRAKRPPILKGLGEGVAFVARHRLLAPVFVTQFVFNIGCFVNITAFVPHAVHGLGMSPAAIGIVLGMYGFGSVAGALLAPKVFQAISFGSVVAIGPISGLAGAVSMALTVWFPFPALAALGFLLMGAGPVLWVISTTTIRQSVTPASMLGRVSAINILAYSARPIGAGLAGLIGGVFGVEACLLTAVALFLLQALVMLLSPLPRLIDQPAAETA